MGLDLYCGDFHTRVGSYSSVHFVRNYLIESLINYLKDESENNKNLDEITILAYQDLINSLGNVLVDNEINYNKLEELEGELFLLDLEGFNCFIIHSDCEGSITFDQSERFIKTFQKVEKSMIKEMYHEDGKFYLYDIFKYSMDNCETIVFC